MFGKAHRYTEFDLLSSCWAQDMLMLGKAGQMVERFSFNDFQEPTPVANKEKSMRMFQLEMQAQLFLWNKKCFTA